MKPSSAKIFSWDNSLYCLVSGQYWNQDQTDLALCNGFYKCSAVTSRSKYYKEIFWPLKYDGPIGWVFSKFESKVMDSCSKDVVVVSVMRLIAEKTVVVVVVSVLSFTRTNSNVLKWLVFDVSILQNTKWTNRFYKFYNYNGSRSWLRYLVMPKRWVHIKLCYYQVGPTTRGLYCMEFFV